MPHQPRVTAVGPLRAIAGGRVTVQGVDLPVDQPRPPEVRIGEVPARVVHASRTTIAVTVPPGLEGGRTPIRIEGVPGETPIVEIGALLATGLHQGDNPVFDHHGHLYVT